MNRKSIIPPQKGAGLSMDVVQSKAMDENPGRKFGQFLGSNDKRTRDKALTALQRWLARRTTRLSTVDGLKIWKGLYYCMWMSDKVPIQQELASKIAELVHVFRQKDDAMMFFRCFLQTMAREWINLDKFRLDKFYSLVRKVFTQNFVYLQRRKWKKSAVKRFITIVSKELINQPPVITFNGLRLHCVDLYVHELCAVAGKDLKHDTFVILMDPFFKSCNDEVIFKRTDENLFRELLQDFEFGLPKAGEVTKATREELIPGFYDDGSPDELHEKPRFVHVDLELLQTIIFQMAAAPDTVEDHRSVLYAYNKLLGQRTGVRFPNIDEGNTAKSEFHSASSDGNNVDDIVEDQRSSIDNGSDEEDEYAKLIHADDSDEEDGNKQSQILQALKSKAQGVKHEGKRDGNNSLVNGMGSQVQSGQKRKHSESQSCSHKALQLSLSIAVPAKASQWTSPSPAKDAHIRLWKQSKGSDSTKKVRFGQNKAQDHGESMRNMRSPLKMKRKTPGKGLLKT